MASLLRRTSYVYLPVPVGGEAGEDQASNASSHDRQPARSKELYILNKCYYYLLDSAKLWQNSAKFIQDMNKA